MNGLTSGGASSGIPGSLGGAVAEFDQAIKQRAQGSIAQRPAVTRQDLIDMSLKLQEAPSLITQALTRMS